MREIQERGDIIAWHDSDNAGTEITVGVTLPRSKWERLTSTFLDFNRIAYEDPDAPDLPLDQRISLFIDSEVQTWLVKLWREDGHPGDDLEDGVPF